VEGGCLGYPGASTVASQPLDRIASHEPPFQVPITLMKQWKGEKKIRDRRGRGIR